MFNGFSEEAIQLFAGQFASAGIVPVMGAGSVSNDKQPEPLEAGSAVSAILVRGDMDIAATCSVTYVDPQRLLACGHPLLQFGSVDLPMNKAEVLGDVGVAAERFQDCEYHGVGGNFCPGSPHWNHGRLRPASRK